jgi:hypothetical protein
VSKWLSSWKILGGCFQAGSAEADASLAMPRLTKAADGIAEYLYRAHLFRHPACVIWGLER